jgi:SAM-dependent methyltransferase
MPFPGATFDLIISNLGINNFANPREALAECLRVGRPGARLALTTNLNGHMRLFYDIFRQALTTLDLSHRLGALNAQEEHRGTVNSVRALLEGAGFRVTKTVERSFNLRFLDGTTLFNHHLIKIGFLDSWRGLLAEDEEERVFAAVEAGLNRIASEEGGLSMPVPMLYIEAEKP